MPESPMKLVIAEDDDGHFSLVERNLRRAGLENELLRAIDGDSALELLEQELEAGSKILLLLDINMPKKSGIDVLKAMKLSKHLAAIPVVMLTTTDDPREIARCYQLGCNVYITKPLAYDAFVEAIKRLGLFVQIIQLPTKAHAAP